MPALVLALLLAACGSSNPSASAGPTASGASAGDDVATASDEPAQDEPLTPAAEPAQDCYVIEVNSQAGCWASAEEACASAGCAEGMCICTEASARNTCGCSS